MRRHTKHIAFKRIASDVLDHIDAILARWLPGGQLQSEEYIVRNPTRADRRLGSFSINAHRSCWADFATGNRGGDLISLAAYLFQVSQAEAAIRLATLLGVSSYDDAR